MTATDRVSDLTVEELRTLVRQTIREALDEFSMDADPDSGLSFRPEVADYLRQFRREPPRGIPLTDALRELGLDA